mmetsp:Transcript_50440/g.83026  ORF Transcript_50440/g.83026 Transcript_50440/m.83026 type:complete len:674 (-) Transcript_50440:253-2274(-)
MVLLNQVLLQLIVKLLCVLRIAAHHCGKAVLLGKELEEIALDLAAIELERIVAMCCQLWVVPVKRPVAAVHCHLAVLNGLGHGETLTDAWAVCKDDAWSRIGISLNHSSHCLLWVDMNANAGHVDILVGHGQLSHVLLLRQLSALSKLCHGSLWRCFGCLSTSVAVHLCVKHQDVHMFLTGNDVVQATIADVVGPAISADNPEAAAAEHVFQIVQTVDLWVITLLLLEQWHELLHDLVVDRSTTRKQQVVHVLLAHHQVLIQRSPELFAHQHLLIRQGVLNLVRQIVASLLESLAHSEAKLGVVLEERVGPCGAFTLGIHGVREGWVGAAPDGGAARGVGNDQTLTEELSHQLHMRGLSTTLAGTTELQVWLLELGALHRGLVDLIATVRQGHSEVPVGFLFLDDLGRICQLQRVSRADAHAQLAAGAVPWRHLDSVLVVVQHSTSDGRTASGAEVLGCCRKLLLSCQERTDSRMRTDQTALVALRAEIHVHLGHVDGNTTLLELAGAQRYTTTRNESAHGQGVSVQVVAGLLHSICKLLGRQIHDLPGPLGILGRSASLPGQRDLRPGGGHRALGDAAHRGVHAVDVHLHHLVTFLAIHLLDALLQHLHSLFIRHHCAELEEDRLHDHVDALSKSRLHRNLGGINDEELGLLLSQILSHLGWQLLLQLARVP